MGALIRSLLKIANLERGLAGRAVIVGGIAGQLAQGLFNILAELMKEIAQFPFVRPVLDIRKVKFGAGFENRCDVVEVPVAAGDELVDEHVLDGEHRHADTFGQFVDQGALQRDLLVIHLHGDQVDWSEIFVAHSKKGPFRVHVFDVPSLPCGGRGDGPDRFARH